MNDHHESPSGTIQQVCAIPFRRRSGQSHFCLITSLKKKRWIFPKGIIDPGETPHESALKEAFEEAGLRGHIVGEQLGQFQDEKWGSRLIVSVVIMQVTEIENRWPEAELRRRRWVPHDMAAEMVSRAELKPFIQRTHEWIEQQAPQ